ncbi:DNA cytosine methyltransferase [Alicyclobacillus hesperidum]|uniref:DNA cytosine methyltransferase n=1 Tax=Alicyclobacillus hesperidum TaxID=89784 RepID=UPI0002EFD5E5|nr:DNA cytosine methyltransferase [Alicyclobacillus hesperidum]
MQSIDSQTYKLSGGKVSAVDLFCGAGGLTHGLERAGISVLLGIDIDPACSYPYMANNKAKFLLKDVNDVTAQEIQEAFTSNTLRLLAGCAPCQTFSTYNQKATQDDKRWWLLRQFSRLITEVSPELVTMENVPNLVGQNVFKEFLQTLKDENYEVSYQVVNCADYGIPQQRKRLVLLASKLGPIKLLQPSELGERTVTVREAIGNLPPLKAGEVSDIDPLHQCSSLSQTNLRRIQASKPGGSWRDWDEELIADCHKKETGTTYPSVYGRMEWDEPAPTITTQFFGFGNGRFGHPEQNRALSLREGAILQSFPRDYQFVPPGEPIYKSTVGRLIGNAVPAKLGEVIGRSILAHVAEFEAQKM